MNEGEKFQPQNAETPEASESIEKPKNPNSIGELAISIGHDLATSPDKVYRSLRTQEAVDDIEKSGVVRNAQSAGVVEKSRWGERIFWSRGVEGKYHAVSATGFVIEAPYAVAEERVVTKDDITAIYKKNEAGEVINLKEGERAVKEAEEKLREEKSAKRRDTEAKRLADLKTELGIVDGNK